MKYLLAAVVTLGLFGCSQTMGNQPVKTIVSKSPIKAPQEAAEDVKKALEQKDYRVLATAGRRVTYPGISSDKYDWVVKYCGRKFMPTTGDAINSNEERNQRIQQIEYMRLYNQEVFKYCHVNLKAQ